MADDIGTEENLPLWEQLKRGIINMSQYLKMMEKQDAEIKNKSKPAKLLPRVDLDQADREERARKKQHPTTGSHRSIPDRWSTHGTVSSQPGQGD